MKEDTPISPFLRQFSLLAKELPDLKERLNLTSQAFNKALVYEPIPLTVEVIDKVRDLIRDLRKAPTTKDASIFLYEVDLIEEFEYVAMHSGSHYAYQWAAFTHEPAFNPETGFWVLEGQKTIPRVPTARFVGRPNVNMPAPVQVSLSLLGLPCDEAGPENALYKRTGRIWQRRRTKPLQKELVYSYPFPTNEPPANFKELRPPYPGEPTLRPTGLKPILIPNTEKE